MCHAVQDDSSDDDDGADDDDDDDDDEASDDSGSEGENPGSVEEGEEEVGSGSGSGSGSDSDMDSDDSDDDDNEERNYLKQVVDSIAPELRRKALGQSADSDDESDEESDEGDGPIKGKLQWGKKSDLYGADTADLEIGQDFTEAEEEEEAVARAHAAGQSRLTEEDFEDDFMGTAASSGSKRSRGSDRSMALGSLEGLNARQVTAPQHMHTLSSFLFPFHLHNTPRSSMSTGVTD